MIVETSKLDLFPRYQACTGSYFQTKKGLRQGDPLSPILFNIAVDMLAIIIARAKENGQVKGAVPHLVEDGLNSAIRR